MSNEDRRDAFGQYAQLPYRPFRYHQGDSALNMRLIGNADPDSIYYQGDIQQAEVLLKNFVGSSLLPQSTMDYEIFSKLFRLSQLAIEHYSQHQQNKQLEIEEQFIKFKSLQVEETNLVTLIQKHESKRAAYSEELKVLSEKIKEMKKQSSLVGSYKCIYCSKTYRERDALEKHTKRRHVDHLNEIYDTKAMLDEHKDPSITVKRRKEEEQREQRRIESERLKEASKNLEQMKMNESKLVDEITRKMKVDFDSRISQLILNNEKRDKEIEEKRQAQKKATADMSPQKKADNALSESLVQMSKNIDHFKIALKKIQDQQEELDQQSKDYNKQLGKIAENQEELKKSYLQNASMLMNQEFAMKGEASSHLQKTPKNADGFPILANPTAEFNSNAQRIQKLQDKQIYNDSFMLHQSLVEDGPSRQRFEINSSNLYSTQNINNMSNHNSNNPQLDTSLFPNSRINRLFHIGDLEIDYDSDDLNRKDFFTKNKGIKNGSGAVNSSKMINQDNSDSGYGNQAFKNNSIMMTMMAQDNNKSLQKQNDKKDNSDKKEKKEKKKQKKKYSSSSSSSSSRSSSSSDESSKKKKKKDKKQDKEKKEKKVNKQDEENQGKKEKKGKKDSDGGSNKQKNKNNKEFDSFDQLIMKEKENDSQELNKQAEGQQIDQSILQNTQKLEGKIIEQEQNKQEKESFDQSNRKMLNSGDQKQTHEPEIKDISSQIKSTIEHHLAQNDNNLDHLIEQKDESNQISDENRLQDNFPLKNFLMDSEIIQTNKIDSQKVENQPLTDPELLPFKKEEIEDKKSPSINGHQNLSKKNSIEANKIINDEPHQKSKLASPILGKSKKTDKSGKSLSSSSSSDEDKKSKKNMHSLKQTKLGGEKEETDSAQKSQSPRHSQGIETKKENQQDEPKVVQGDNEGTENKQNQISFGSQTNRLKNSVSFGISEEIPKKLSLNKDLLTENIQSQEPAQEAFGDDLLMIDKDDLLNGKQPITTLIEELKQEKENLNIISQVNETPQNSSRSNGTEPITATVILPLSSRKQISDISNVQKENIDEALIQPEHVKVSDPVDSPAEANKQNQKGTANSEIEAIRKSIKMQQDDDDYDESFEEEPLLEEKKEVKPQSQLPSGFEEIDDDF